MFERQMTGTAVRFLLNSPATGMHCAHPSKDCDLLALCE